MCPLQTAPAVRPAAAWLAWTAGAGQAVAQGDPAASQEKATVFLP